MSGRLLTPTLRRRTLVGLGLALVAMLALDLLAGPSGVGWPDALAAPLRVRRALLAVIVGAALASSGAALQALLRNVLAEPFVIGVSGGAALGGAIPIAVGASFALAVPLGAIGGALLASAFLAWFLARDRDAQSHKTLLVGVALNAFAAALITVVKTLLPPDRTAALLFWLVGTIGYVDVLTLSLVAAAVALSIALLVARSGDLELLALGHDEALRLGVDVRRARVIAYLACSLAVGAVVPVSGLVGFVGVVVPHALRLVWSPDLRLLVPASALLGGAVLALLDALSRLAFPLLHTELPVGALCALFGAPFFAFALIRDTAPGEER